MSTLLKFLAHIVFILSNVGHSILIDHIQFTIYTIIHDLLSLELIITSKDSQRPSVYRDYDDEREKRLWWWERKEMMMMREKRDYDNEREKGL